MKLTRKLMPLLLIGPHSCALAATARSSRSADACLSTASLLPGKSPLRILCDPDSFTALAHVPSSAEARFNSSESGQTKSYPLLLYLHGMGQSGHDISKTLDEPATGSPPVELHFGRAVQELRDKFVMVAPQTNRGWQSQDLEGFVRFLLDRSTHEMLGVQLDSKRFYITGHSIGGTAALIAASMLRTTSGKPRFAAVVPVAPSYISSFQGLQGQPVWLHHGANDIIAPVAASDHAYQELQSINPGSDMLRYSRYDYAPTAPGRNPHTHAGHASPILAYQDPELYNWLLSQQQQ
eukprot:TRINITY_DN4129_c0_g2_i5.p1 TRINITY_DN4129_c0_g2~~TRINITY_DN4129_c0_g2_i5.p1  ORF type:complete len:294 (-),score=19.88 TRINITY_DN4129_c0_g2_i5:373-1254(-)